jgi:transcriptional regulator with XRE-family HTH domain/succinate dehydrogenase flavin-adding protein (antitoxin of CptAB toxin-antitoxin module)
MMIHKLENDLERRKQAKKDFYFSSIGILVKKTRLKKKLTQENVARGICSNTYLSKFEHNTVPINEEYLSLIMERIDIGYNNFMLPDEMIDSFMTALDCFINDDKERYETLIHGMKTVEFAVLVDIARLGYYVINNNQKEAETTADELYHYLQSMEGDALGVYMLFNAGARMINFHFDEGLKILNLFNQIDSYSDDLVGIIAYLKFICYGNLGMMNYSRNCADEARMEFTKTKNYRRLAMIDLHLLEFTFYESGLLPQLDNESFLKLLNQEERDLYHLLMGKSEIESIKNFDMIGSESPFYSEMLFSKCIYLKAMKIEDDYLETKSILKTVCNQRSSKVDYHHWLNLIELKIQYEMKEFMAETILPYALSRQSFYLMKIATNEIVSYLARSKRYKEALQYVAKLENDLAHLQGNKKPIGAIVPLPEFK